MSEVEPRISFAGETIKEDVLPVSKYLTPGIHLVKLTKAEEGLSPAKGTPYIRLYVEDKTGASQTFEMYLSTTLGKKGLSAYNMTITKIFELGVAILGGEEKTRTTLDSANTTELTSKINTNLTNKFFKLKLSGEEVLGAKGVFVKTKLGFGRVAENAGVPDAETKLRYNPDFDIKRLPVGETSEPSEVISGNTYL